MSARLVWVGLILVALCAPGCCWHHWHGRHCRYQAANGASAPVGPAACAAPAER
jgi:hypothetical protein